MSDKDSNPTSGTGSSPGSKTESKDTASKPSKEERLAEALRANLRRRKSAAKSRKDG